MQGLPLEALGEPRDGEGGGAIDRWRRSGGEPRAAGGPV